MRLAVASGKGGTGKTLVATNLAWSLAARTPGVTYVDADVEAPNERGPAIVRRSVPAS